MPTGFDDPSVSARVRDAIERIAEGILKEKGVTYRYGTVTAINYAEQKVSVQFAGSNDSMPVKTLGVQPTEVGQVVQVTGKQGDHFVSGVVGTTSLVGADPDSLTAPTLTLDPYTESVVASWTLVQNAAAYEVEFAEDNAFTVNPVTFQISGNSFTYHETDHTKTLYARVRALTSHDPPQAGPWSATQGPVSPVEQQGGVSTDGNPPADSPDVTVTSGLGYLQAAWPEQANADPVTYEVHIGLNSGFTPGPTTLYDEITGRTSFIDTLADGTPLAYDTDYYVRILAKDADGAAPTAGAQDIAQISRVETGDAGNIGVNNLSDGNVPSTSPDVGNVTSGIGYLFVTWAHISNADPVTYEVHVSMVNDFAPDANTRVGDTPSNYFFIREQGPGAGSAPLDYATTYYVKIIAYDADGYAASYGLQGSGSSLRAVSDDFGDGSILAAKLADNAVTTQKLAADAVTAAKLANDAVGTEHVQALAITAAEVAANAITTAKIAADAITAGELANDAVGNEHLQALAVAAGNVQDSAITTAKIAADAVTAGELANDAVGNEHIQALAISAAELQDSAVTTAKILDGAVTELELANDAVSSIKIQDGAVSYTELASGLEPVRPVASLPALPSATYPEGSVVFLTTDGKLYRNVADSWDATVPAGDLTGAITETQITDGAISTPKLATDAVTADKILAGTITASELAANTITAGQIAAGAINTSELAAGAVTATEIAANTITAGEIATGAITADELAANSVVAGKIAADAVTASEIAALTITAGEIAADAITTAKINAGAVTAAEIAAGTITANQIAADTITAGNIAAGAITTAELDAGAVTAAKIAALTITAGEIAADAITTAKINAGAVTATEIAADTILASNIAAGAITTTELDAGAVTAAKIAALTITSSEIAADAITTAKIFAGAVTASEIAANTILASNIAANTITAAQIAADTITAAEIAAGTITATQIAADTITANEIAASTITAAQMVADTITAASGIIADAAIDTAQIANAAITTALIADAQISTAKIDALAVTDAKINDLAVNKLTAGTLTADVIVGTGEISAVGAAGEVLLDGTGLRMWDNTTRTGAPTVEMLAADGSANFTGTITGSDITGSTITGSTIQTAAPGNDRLEIDVGGLEFYKGAESVGLLWHDSVSSWVVLDVKYGFHVEGSVAIGAGARFSAHERGYNNGDMPYTFLYHSNEGMGHTGGQTGHPMLYGYYGVEIMSSNNSLEVNRSGIRMNSDIYTTISQNTGANPARIEMRSDYNIGTYATAIFMHPPADNRGAGFKVNPDGATLQWWCGTRYAGSPSEFIIGADNGDQPMYLANAKMRWTHTYVYSDPIYASTGSQGANVTIYSSGNIRRSTSSRRYKQDIEAAPLDADKIANLPWVQWLDRGEVEEHERRGAIIGPTREEGEWVGVGDDARPGAVPTPYYGVTAEDVDDAGLEWAITRDEQGRPDAANYDRLALAAGIAALREVRELREELLNA